MRYEVLALKYKFFKILLLFNVRVDNCLSLVNQFFLKGNKSKFNWSKRLTVKSKKLDRVVSSSPCMYEAYGANQKKNFSKN